MLWLGRPRSQQEDFATPVAQRQTLTLADAGLSLHQSLAGIDGPTVAAIVRSFLEQRQPTLRKGHVLLASLVAAGEVPVGLAMYNSNIETLKRKGAPIDYVPVQPVVARPQGIGVARNAPHPNAALLFADYVLSPEGQKLFESMGRVPASTKIKSEFNNFPFTVIDPVTVIDESAKWDKVWNDLFLKR